MPEQAQFAVVDGPIAGLRVLVIEDNPTLRSLIEETIQRVGGHVRSVASGRTALECFHTAAQSDAPFEAAVVDLRMPVLSGVEILEGLRKLDQNVMLIAMSGAHVDRETRDFFRRTNVEFLQKPFSLEQLINALGTV